MYGMSLLKFAQLLGLLVFPWEIMAVMHLVRIFFKPGKVGFMFLKARSPILLASGWVCLAKQVQANQILRLIGHQHSQRAFANLLNIFEGIKEKPGARESTWFFCCWITL